MNTPVDDAIAIWKAGVAAVDPKQLVVEAVTNWHPYLKEEIEKSRSIRVVGAGKAGAAMALGLETVLATHLEKVIGIVNVPEGFTEQTQRIKLHSARPAGSNHPTEAGVSGSNAMLELMATATTEDMAICLISGGGSALLPAPVDGVTLADKQAVTKLLHASGATIEEMNAVRTHLSRIKGGRLSDAFRGTWLVSLIISDVIGNPLHVIASGPTAEPVNMPSFARNVLSKYRLWDDCPNSIQTHLKQLDDREEYRSWPKLGRLNQVIGSNQIAANVCAVHARKLDYRIQHAIDDGSGMHDQPISGEAKMVAGHFVAEVHSVSLRPTAILFGGETTVTLGSNPGKGGRNQEFVLAMLCELGEAGMKGVTILSGGTDGEDGPTDAAGAIGTLETLQRAKSLDLNPHDYLARHDAYHFFEATGGLFKTGLTGTNVMDLGVILLV